MQAQATEERDYFTDPEVLLDPYDYFEEMYAKGPITKMAMHDILMITGYEEAIEVLRNNVDFSGVNALDPVSPLPFTPEGDDISAQIEAHRGEIFGSNLVVAYDGTAHARLRAVASRLFTPSRLKANEKFMFDYADELARNAAAKGGCELVNEISTPFVTLVVADLLGVSAEHRDKFAELIHASSAIGNIEEVETPSKFDALMNIAGLMAEYISERRENPQDDVLTTLATAKYQDGTDVPLDELITLSAFLFAAGQDTSAKLISNSMRHIIERPGLQQKIRQNPELIPGLIEEVLRLEGSTKATFRVAVRNTKIGDMEIPAGQRMVVALGAANRDPRRWENPKEFIFDRPRIREHLSFGRGVHTCLGAPLARAEVKIMLERLIEHTSDFQISEEKHGKPGNRKLQYEPSFIIRGLDFLHLDMTAK